VTLDQQRRYARQIMLADVGEAGQQKLRDARVLVVGAGGLGSALISYLAAAGVGHIGIIDDDRVELSNLARQIIHETGDIGRLKVESAADRVAELNPEVKVTTYPFALTAENAAEIIRNYDSIADGCDNFSTRFIVNQTCITHRIPLVSAAIAGWQGQVMTIAPHLAADTGCYHCFAHPDAPEANTCRESGIIGPLAGIIGSMQALEVVNTILSRPALLGKIARYDARTMEQRVSNLGRDAGCRVCSALPARTTML
jgi:molybdopterin/thiamine biosynthesis adenylyltransferase